MQHQPPDSNNPSNPLLKIAALALNKEYKSLPPTPIVRLVASLNLKGSNDLRGTAKSEDGLDITVSFSLALRRANLQIHCSLEGSGGTITISKVAFSAPMGVWQRVKNSVTRGGERGFTLAGRASVDVISANAQADGKVAGGLGRHTKLTHQESL